MNVSKVNTESFTESFNRFILKFIFFFPVEIHPDP